MSQYSKVFDNCRSLSYALHFTNEEASENKLDPNENYADSGVQKLDPDQKDANLREEYFHQER